MIRFGLHLYRNLSDLEGEGHKSLTPVRLQGETTNEESLRAILDGALDAYGTSLKDFDHRSDGWDLRHRQARFANYVGAQEDGTIDPEGTWTLEFDLFVAVVGHDGTPYQCPTFGCPEADDCGVAWEPEDEAAVKAGQFEPSECLGKEWTAR